jgi:hypothetical protein
MPNYCWITVLFSTPLIFHYHLPLRNKPPPPFPRKKRKEFINHRKKWIPTRNSWGHASCTHVPIDKGTVSRVFRLNFLWNRFPQAPENLIRAASNFFQKCFNYIVWTPFHAEKFEMTLMLFSGTLGKMIHEKNLKQKISWHCPYQAISFNEEYYTHGSGEFILLSIAHGVKMAETGKINSETNRQKTAQWQKTGKPTVRQR